LDCAKQQISASGVSLWRCAFIANIARDIVFSNIKANMANKKIGSVDEERDKQELSVLEL